MALLSPNYTEDQLYAAYQDRLLIKSLGIQAGVVGLGDYKVEKVAGASLQVTSKSGNAFVEQTKAIEESENTFYNGMYFVSNPKLLEPSNTVTVPTINPQIAQIILRVYDEPELKGAGESKAKLEWLNGSESAEATEAKMKEGIYKGVAALPQSSFRLAYILVPKNATKAEEYYIEDARAFRNNFSLGPMISRSGNYAAKAGEFAIQEKSGGITYLPSASTDNQIIGVWCAGTATSAKIIVSGEARIFGDFINNLESNILLPYQHVIYKSFGGNWLIIAGEPKREQKYSVLTKREIAEELEVSATRPAFVVGELLFAGAGEALLQVGGVTLAEAKVSGAGKIPFTLPVLAGQKWRSNNLGGLTEVRASYLLL